MTITTDQYIFNCHYTCVSNFHKCHIGIDGLCLSSIEHYEQNGKAMLGNEAASSAEFKLTTHPAHNI